MPVLKPLEKIFKKTPYQDWQRVPALVQDLHSLDGERISKTKALSRLTQSIAPAMLSNKRIVVGDLIPYTSWGSSLANLLTRASWNKLRHPLISSHHNVCELCGDRQNSLDVHEVWSYEFPTLGEIRKAKNMKIFGIQKLEGLMAVCNDCHRCFHLGRESSMGTLDITLARLSILNNWGPADVKSYYDTVTHRWDLTSSVNWQLDLENVNHPDGHLTIKNPWKVHPKDVSGKMLTKANEYGEPNLTTILNAHWILEETGEFGNHNTDRSFFTLDV